MVDFGDNPLGFKFREGSTSKSLKFKDVNPAGDSYQLREPSASYGEHFGAKNEDIGPKTPIFGILIHEYQRDSLARPQ